MGHLPTETGSVSLLMEQMWADTPVNGEEQTVWIQGSLQAGANPPVLSGCQLPAPGTMGGRKASDPGALGLGGWDDPSQLVVWVT